MAIELARYGEAALVAPYGTARFKESRGHGWESRRLQLEKEAFKWGQRLYDADPTPYDRGTILTRAIRGALGAQASTLSAVTQGLSGVVKAIDVDFLTTIAPLIMRAFPQGMAISGPLGALATLKGARTEDVALANFAQDAEPDTANQLIALSNDPALLELTLNLLKERAELIAKNGGRVPQTPWMSFNPGEHSPAYQEFLASGGKLSNAEWYQWGERYPGHCVHFDLRGYIETARATLYPSGGLMGRLAKDWGGVATIVVGVVAPYAAPFVRAGVMAAQARAGKLSTRGYENALAAISRYRGYTPLSVFLGDVQRDEETTTGTPNCQSCKISARGYWSAKNLPQGEFFRSESLVARVVPAKDGPWGEISFRRWPAQLTVNGAAGPVRGRYTVAHEAVHYMDRLLKLGLDEKQTHAAGVLLVDKVVPLMRAWDHHILETR